MVLQRVLVVYFYRQQSLGLGNVFHLCVILFTGGCVSQHGMGRVSVQPLSPADTSLGRRILLGYILVGHLKLNYI